MLGSFAALQVRRISLSLLVLPLRLAGAGRGALGVSVVGVSVAEDAGPSVLPRSAAHFKEVLYAVGQVSDRVGGRGPVAAGYRRPVPSPRGRARPAKPILVARDGVVARSGPAERNLPVAWRRRQVGGRGQRTGGLVSRRCGRARRRDPRAQDRLVHGCHLHLVLRAVGQPGDPLGAATVAVAPRDDVVFVPGTGPRLPVTHPERRDGRPGTLLCPPRHPRSR